MSATILIDRTKHGSAAALWADGKLQDLLIDAPEEDLTPRPGAIYRGIVEKPIKGIQGSMIRLPDGQQGFLRETKGLAPGQRILCQVNTYAEAGKSAPVTRRLLFKSRFAIVTPEAPGLNIARSIRDEDVRDGLGVLAREAMDGSDFGLIVRSSAASADEATVFEDIAAMRGLAEQVLSDDGQDAALLVDAPTAEELAWRDWDPSADVIAEDGAFERFDVWGAVEALRFSKASMGKGWLSVDGTPALVAIDVNSGGDFSPAATLKANRDAVRELPRQLRLRGLGGQIVVDFAPMNKRDRREIETMLKAAFRADPVETSLAGWSNLGLFELQRKRERRPILECLGGD